jgi:hypothetical protein
MISQKTCGIGIMSSRIWAMSCPQNPNIGVTDEGV